MLRSLVKCFQNLILCFLSYLTIFIFVTSTFLVFNPVFAFALSGNSYLASLEVEGLEISPGFRKTTLSYEMQVPESINNIVVNAFPEDLSATVEISGNNAFQSGKNTVSIMVNAQDGSSTEYRLFVWREGALAGDSALLDVLHIEGYDLNPVFREDVFSYHTYISYEVTALEVIAVPVDANAQITVLGADTLTESTNEIVVKVVSADASATEEYRIIAEKLERYDEVAYRRFLVQEWIRENVLWVLLATALIGIVVAVGTILVLRRRRNT